MRACVRVCVCEDPCTVIDAGKYTWGALFYFTISEIKVQQLSLGRCLLYRLGS